MPENFVTHTRCTVCGSTYAVDEVAYTCPICGPAGTLDLLYDYEKLQANLTADAISAKHDPTMWRYGPLLPIFDDKLIPPMPVGGTPLIETKRLADMVGLESLWLKDEGRNPTGSIKDRSSAMVVARAMEIKAPILVTASTGNSAAALASVCASVGKKAVIFVPAKVADAKIAQLLIYGAVVFVVNGSYSDAYQLSIQAAEEYGWYCRHTGRNPYATEGLKTAAFEIAEQFGWQPPDVVITSVGDGSIIGGVYKGFYDLRQLGWIKKLPRLIGVQAEGSANMVNSWIKGQDPALMTPGPGDTTADSISTALPQDRVKAMRAVRLTGGVYVSVSDKAILAAIPELARHTGVFAELAAAATLAGLRQAQLEGAVAPHERVVLLITGNGLKDTNRATNTMSALHIENSMAEVRRKIETLALVGDPA